MRERETQDYIIRNDLDLLEAQKKLLELEELERRYRDTHKIEFFQPLYYQQKVIDYIKQGKKRVLLQGGNRIGKTTILAVLAYSLGMGYLPWTGEKFIYNGRPIRMRFVGVDWEHHIKETIEPKFKEWFIAGTYKTKKNNVGAEYLWTFRNGSQLEIMTHIQDTKQHEGWSGDVVFFDEPPPRDKYLANLRGLIDRGGIAIMAFTAVYETWVLDEIVLANDPAIGCVTEIPIYENKYLKREDIEVFARALNEEEKVARINGGWLQLAGKVYKEFNPDIHIIEPFRVRQDYPVVAMIDIHLSKPQAVGFYAVDEHNRVYVIDEIWANASPEELADMIAYKKRENGWRLERAFIDPLSKGDNKYLKNRKVVRDSFAVISDHLRPYGIRLDVASKDIASGIRAVKSALTGPNKMPTLFFFKNCERHLYEIQRYVYNGDGMPKKENDDMMENLYRFFLAGVSYVHPSVWEKPLTYVKPAI